MKLAVLLACVISAACTAVRPADRTAALQQATSLDGRHKSEAALRLLDSMLQADRQRDDLTAKLCLLKSKILRERKDLEGARRFLAAMPAFTAVAPLTAYKLEREEAIVFDESGDLEGADRHLLQAMAAAGRGGYAPRVAATQVTRARILADLGRFSEAQQSLDAANRYVLASGDHSMDAVILLYSGKVLWGQNQFEAAIAPLESAVLKFKSSPPRAASTMIDLAWVDFRLGNLDQAQHLYEEAEKISEPEDKALCVGHLGNIHYDRGELDRAIASYKMAAALERDYSQNYYANWLANLATALEDKKQWDQADFYNSKALPIARSIPRSLALARAIINRGRIAAGKGYLHLAEEDLQTVENQSDARPADRLDAFVALAGIYADAHRDQQAKQQYEAALKLVDEQRTTLQEDSNKLNFLASLMKLHQRYVAFLMARGEDAHAFQVSEMSRARMLRDRLGTNTAALRVHGIAEYQQAAAQSGSTYLVYWVGREKSFLWVVGATRFASFRLPREQEIRGLVERFQRTLERNEKQAASDRDAGTLLFSLLIEPARKLLPATKRFVVVPDGPLYGINFETLPYGSQYWIQDATIAIAPSLDLLLSPSAVESAKPTLLLVGDATEWTHQFPKLLNAGKEMTRIERQFSLGPATVLPGNRATTAAYSHSRPADYAYIHFAAHATANRASPLESAIILADGKLTAKDILAMPVRARLVTISACSSAGARTYAGEGLVGLAWAFLRSGAHGVIAGLWDVSDYSSPILMESLYSGLARGERPADALRAAKLKLLEPGSKFADPYYWGAFQLYLGSR